ncbi:MAG TPA: xanthine dehydrogenase, partial [Polyangiaceae bacterium]|nr:xanthine dehydrogenase [Polyangiaceae bacterium]
TQFFTGYRKTVMRADELITRIEVRIPAPGARVVWRKVGTRQAQSISKVALASVVESSSGVLAHVRFGMASVAASTHPLEHARRHLEGRAVDALDFDALDQALARDIQPIDDVRSTGEYRMHVAHRVLRRALSLLDRKS